MSARDPAPSTPSRWRGLANALAGPLLVIGTAIVVLHAYVFRALTFHADVLTLWLPTFCHLGRTIASGHVPAWDPYVMGGVPFAADPQSGWMYAPAMLLFGILPCGTAIRLMVLIQPVLAGLGIYWFLRSEGAGRPAATLGGLVLSLGICGSELAVAIPFSAALAWTALLLASASRYLRAPTWPARFLWCLAAAFAWGQLSAAFATDGLIFGSIALLAYYLAFAFAGARRERLRDTAALGGLLFVAMGAVNLAYFLPRLGYAHRTELGQGYASLIALAARIRGAKVPGLALGPATGARWPLDLATSPGAYLGAAALALSLAGWWVRRHRTLAVAFGAFGAFSFVLSLRRVANAVPPAVRSLPVVDAYLHDPQRPAYWLLVAVAILAGLGLEAWRASPTIAARIRLLVPGVLIWWLLPFGLGARTGGLVLLAAGATAAIVVLGGSIRWPSTIALIPVLVAAELTANGLAAGSNRFLPTGAPKPFAPLPALIKRLPTPDVPLAGYLDPGPIGLALPRNGLERYTSVGPRGAQEKSQPAGGYGLLDQAMVFRVENAGGYNSVQPIRYWTFVREAEKPEKIPYNLALFIRPSPVAFNLLQVGMVIAPDEFPQPAGWTAVRAAGSWVLYRLTDIPPRVSVATSWVIRSSTSRELAAVLAPGFDPSTTAVVEGSPGLRPGGTSEQAGRATYRPQGPGSARIDVNAPAPAILVVRNSYDPGWRATVDGRPARTMVVDYFLQGAAVPSGRHTVQLVYEDPLIGEGLLGSAVSIASFLLAAAFLRRRKHLGEPESSERSSTSAQEHDPPR